MELILMPEWTPLMIALHVFLSANALTINLVGRLGLVKIRYSKFRTGTGISGRTGMFVLYAVPLLVLVAVSMPYLPHATTIQWILFGALAVHFAKRCLEVLFVHSYSGPIDLFSVVSIAVNYSVVTGVLAWMHARTVSDLDALFVVGGVFYVVGELGNFVHHVFLARLRRGASGYFVPRGGLFEQVAAPHYLFELVAWTGILLMSRHLAAFLFLALMVNYLTDRANATWLWYRERFADFPPQRRRMVPLVY